MSQSNIKKIVIGLLILFVIGGLVYLMFIKSPPAIPVDVLIPQEQSQIAGQDILVLIDKLKSVSIDSSLFSSVLFTSLKDLSIPVNPESQGRPNPFAIIGVDSGSVSTKVPIKAPGQ